MIALPGYRQLTDIADTYRSTISRGQREPDGKSVILKRLKRAEPGSIGAQAYQREFEILRHLNGVAGVVEAYELEWAGNSLVMALEDLGGESLRQVMESNPPDLATSVDIAVRIAGVLGQIHASGVIHNSVTPHHIICNTKTGEIRFICFGNATLLSLENPTLPNPKGAETGLPYISPEQTGRMNRKVDYRSDYYALGATFYELFSGKPPFTADDPMEIVYAHMAKQPEPLDEAVDGFPDPLSGIIGKLLAKNAENRYQSAWGLQADLKECARQLRETGTVSSFPLGREDVSDRFQIPEKIYGRDAEIESLVAAFDRASSGGREFMLVSGYSGIGKTFLVREVYKPLARKRGFFISGKFDQFQRNIPYSAFISAFSGLIGQLLTGSESQLADWRGKLLAALGANGQIVVDVLPEVELIVGPQPPVSELPPSESKNRFNRVFLEFIRTFHKPEHPLVVFIDDLQWADADSLALIEILMTDASTGHLFLIGAYRDNEVGPDHPLLLTFENLEKKRGQIKELALTPLAIGHIEALLGDTLHADAEAVRPLAELVIRKTDGNPFFVNQFLTTLHQEGVLTFETKPRDSGVPNRRWHWDVQGIEKLDFTDNVVDLVISKLMRLPADTRHVLQLAACIGNRFDLHTLAIIQQRSPTETYNDLLPAVQQGLVLTTSELTFSERENDPTQLLVLDFRFLHDRVQQAAYALIADPAKRNMHLKIARLLSASLDEDEKSARLFELADHFNTGIELLTKPSERLDLVDLNTRACRKAKSSTAYDSALRYLRKAMEACLDCDEAPSGLPFSLNKERAELEYLNGNYEESEHYLDLAIGLAETAIDKVAVHDLHIVQSTMLGKHQEAIATGRMALGLLDITVPQSDLKGAIHDELDHAQQTLGDREIATLFDAPAMTLPEKKAAMRLLNNLTPAAYFHETDLYTWILAKMANLSLEYGHTAESGKGYTSFGNVLVYERDAFQQGYEFGMLGLRLCREINHLAYVCRSCFVATAFLIHWVRHIGEADALGEEGYRAGLESGEFLYAGYVQAFNNVMNGFFRGRNLPALQDEMIKRLPFLQQTNNRLALDMMSIFGDTIRTLRGGEDNVPSESIEPWSDDTSPTVIGVWLVLKSVVHYLYGRPEKALAQRREVEARRSFLSGTMASAAHQFYDSLILAACYANASESEQKTYRAELANNRSRLETWTRSCPENFEHKSLLVAAEMARLDGDVTQAMEFYDRSIAAAGANGFVQEEALANELAAKFWLAQKKEDFARLYLLKAHEGYRTWGALGKARQLEQDFAPYFVSADGGTLVDKREASPTEQGAAISENNLDLTAVIRASQAISGEIVLERLLNKMMGIVIESAGAEKGSLILIKGNQLVVEAQAHGDKEVNYPGVPVEGYDDAPTAILNYVARTQNEVILDDASKDDFFSKDDYVRRNAPRSVFCIPIVSQGSLTAVLYLENNQAVGAFTAERVDLLRLISAQAAISLENAEFYASLQTSEEKFRLLYQNALEGLFESDSKGRIQYANPAMAQALGFESPDALMSSQRNADNAWFVDPDKRRQFLEAIAEQGQVSDFEALFYRKDGTPTWISISAQAASDGARIEGFLLDIGVRKEKEEAERERREAEAATQAKSQFLANMSHEIRTPLNAVIGLTHLALRTELTPKQVDYLRKIRGSSQSLLGIINDILDFSKIEAGKLTIERIPFDLRDVMDNLSNVIAIKAGEKDLEVLLSMGGDVPYHLIGDPLRLGQVLINLASNAVKFTETGEVVISTDQVEQEDGITRLRFSVRDSGIGMTPQQTEGLFQSFHQADASVTRKYGGTGLGLAISKQLVEMMDGQLHLESEMGVGSTFWFDVKLGITPQPEQGNGLLVPEGLRGERVLVVDDNATAREILQNMLEGFAFEVETTDSGETALQILKDRATSGKPPFGMVLMDWNMPGMNGIETATQIRNDADLDTIPSILMVTAYGREEVMKAAEKAGLDGFLVKPVGQSLLFNTIMETFGEKTVDGHGGTRSIMRPEQVTGIHGARVLLVEDNPLNQQVAEEFLTQAGLIVEVANTGLKALEMVGSNAYDLVLMDIQMPEMDGLEATRRIRAQKELMGLPVVAMTAHAMVSDREKSLDAGMNDHLTKPIDPDELIDVLIRWIPIKDRGYSDGVRRDVDVERDANIALPDISGLDTTRGVKLVGGTRRLYVKLLADFADKYIDAASRIRSGLQAGNLVEAGRLAHTIKGSSGSLGAVPLFDVAQELEEAIRDNETEAIPRHLLEFEETLVTLCQNVRAFFAEQHPDDGERRNNEPDRDKAAEVIEGLRACLISGDSEAEDKLAELQQTLKGLGLESRLDELEACIEDVEFEDALDRLEYLEMHIAKGAEQ